jgi:hypothetical protein
VELANERVITSAGASGRSESSSCTTFQRHMQHHRSTDQNVFISLFALPESEVLEEKQVQLRLAALWHRWQCFHLSPSSPAMQLRQEERLAVRPSRL